FRVAVDGAAPRMDGTGHIAQNGICRITQKTAGREKIAPLQSKIAPGADDAGRPALPTGRRVRGRPGRHRGETLTEILAGIDLFPPAPALGMIDNSREGPPATRPLALCAIDHLDARSTRRVCE